MDGCVEATERIMQQLSPEHRMPAVVAFIVPIVLVLLLAAGWGGERVQASSGSNATCPPCEGEAACMEALRCE